MRTRNIACLGAVLFLASVAPAGALTIGFGGSDDPSLHGATGSLTIESAGAGHYTVTWSMDFTGFDVAGATATGHTLLTDVAFKAFSSISSVSLDDPTIGTLYFPSNVNNASQGCDTDGSSANFVCVALDPTIDATSGGSFSAVFHVAGALGSEVSYRGKFGEDDGWVISESSYATRRTNPPVPEPSSALVFAAGGLLVGARLRRRA